MDVKTEGILVLLILALIYGWVVYTFYKDEE